MPSCCSSLKNPNNHKNGDWIQAFGKIGSKLKSAVMITHMKNSIYVFIQTQMLREGLFMGCSWGKHLLEDISAQHVGPRWPWSTLILHIPVCVWYFNGLSFLWITVLCCKKMRTCIIIGFMPDDSVEWNSSFGDKTVGIGMISPGQRLNQKN